MSVGAVMGAVLREKKAEREARKKKGNKGKGWHGDTPGHKAAANRRRVEGVSRTPMRKKPTLKEKIIKKWEADLKARRSWSGNKEGFTVFDSNSGDGSIEKLSEILSKGQEGYDDYANEIQERNFESLYEMFRSTWAEFLKDEGIDLDESGLDDDHDIMETARMMFEENINWNVEKLFEYDVLLIDSKRYDAFEYEASNVATAEEAEFRNKALKYISEQGFNEILNNSYGGTGFFGIIINARDIIEAIRDDKKTVSGKELVIGIHDRLSGSGYFKQVNLPKDQEYTITLSGAELDEGSYSLGDIFGGVDWKWR